MDYIPKFDERAVSDATLVGAMHEAMVKDMLNGTKTSCKFQCDSDFGCNSCSPAGLTAEPEKPEISPKKGNAAVAYLPMDSSHIPWIADTGAAQDLLSRTDAETGGIYESSQPLKFSTANGNIFGTEQANVKIKQTDSVVRPYTGETVNIFYSDRAPELVKAADQLEWKHVQSTNYISKANAIAERNVRAIIEGTRTNLEQAGLHHTYWPHAAKHYCMAHNITDHPDYHSPWKVRFGEDFPGPYLPFGCQVNFWTGPRNRPNKPLKFEPTSRAGIFLGYPIHPDFLWRHELLVVPLRDLVEKDYDQPIAPLRVNQIKCPDGDFFRMVERHLLHMNGVMPGLEDAPECLIQLH